MKGIVDGLARNGAYNEGNVNQGKNAGKEYKTIRFQVQTSATNKLSVELFGMEMDHVFAYKHGNKKKGTKGDTKRIDFEDRHDDLPTGYQLIGINMGLEQNEAGKNIRTTMVAYDAVEYIYDNLNDGDSVKVQGELQFGEYEGNPQIRYVINSIYKEADIDFEDEKFEEVAGFSQEIVIAGTNINSADKTLEITAYTIQYGNKFTPAQFVIRPEDDKDLAKLLKAFQKLKFGDFIQVEGLCMNNAVVTEVKEAPKENPFGGKRPKGVQRDTVTNYVTELQITYADGATYKKGLYDEGDFVEDELIEDEDEGEEEVSFGGKKKGGLGSDDEEDISEDELPF
jgi:hypothetical protein